MKKCIGCGAVLQNINSNQIGYVVDLEKEYCQRCFKMIHYNQHENPIEKIDNEQIIAQLSSLKGQYVWIIDIFDFDSSLKSVFKDFYQNQKCLIVLNKCDLLPDQINYQHLGKYVLKHLKKLNINTIGIITRGVNDDFVETFDQFVDISEPIIMTGLANVGKSTIINQLLNKKVVTTNPFPATTININEIKSNKYHLYDTVGIVNYGSFALHLSQKKLKSSLPNKQVKPIVYQINSDQSFALGGLARIDILTKNSGSVVFYCNNLLNIHRGKVINADKLWQNNYDIDLKPVSDSCDCFADMKRLTFKNHGKNDYFISGLGFITVNCKECEVDIYCDKAIEIIQKEAMI